MGQLVVRYFRVFGVAVLVALLARVAQAAPIQYSEGISGDLSQTPSTTLQFDVGSNTISGSTRFLSFIEPEPNCHFCTDFDSFRFDLPANTKLTSIVLSWDIDANNVRRADSDYALCSGAGCPGAVLGLETVDWLGGSPVVVLDFDGVLPLGSGTFTVSNTAIGIAQLDTSHGVGMGWTADYTWTFGVTAIPEPASFLLVALALGAFGLTALRQRR